MDSELPREPWKRYLDGLQLVLPERGNWMSLEVTQICPGGFPSQRLPGLRFLVVQAKKKTFDQKPTAEDTQIFASSNTITQSRRKE